MWSRWQKVGGKFKPFMAGFPAGVEALRSFEMHCDAGSPGTYELRAGDLVLATAKVKADEYQIDWHKPRIFYAMGVAGAVGLDDVAAWLEGR